MNTVFLVDDDLFVRKGLLSLIDWEGCGYKACAEADNGEDALKIIKEINPDLVVTDIRMPVLDGLDLIKHTLESTDLKPIFVIISGHNDFKYAQQAMRYGVHDFILKPIDKEEFEKTLRKLSEKLKKEKMMRKKKEKMVATTCFENILTGEVSKANDVDLVQILNMKKVMQITYIIVEVNQIVSDITKITDLIHKTISSYAKDDFILIREHDNGSFGTLITDLQLRSSFGGDMERYIQGLQQLLSQKLQKEVSLYVGKHVKHPNEIKDSFETAKMAAQFKYTELECKHIYFEKIKNTSVNYIELDQSFYNSIMEQIEENNVEIISSSIDEMFRQFCLKMFARDAVKTSINRYVHEVIKTIKSLDGDENELSTLEEMLQWDNSPFTLTEIKELFTKFVLEASELIYHLNKENAKGSIHKIKKYVETHYQENLTLKSIANTFYMNPVYIGQLFKKTYGVYFKDYILQIRINKAKKLLRQTDMRVYEVAGNVGFANADYFFSQFEKIEGMTPTQYRRKISQKSK